MRGNESSQYIFELNSNSLSLRKSQDDFPLCCATAVDFIRDYAWAGWCAAVVVPTDMGCGGLEWPLRKFFSNYCQ